jgi:DNA polymerase I-like protein with 3'-5' exonuclease and polymerase domains
MLQIAEWQQRVNAACAARGYVSLPTSGRRRYIASIHSASHRNRTAAERKAVNTMAQGAAADVFKWAQLRLEERLQEDGLGEHVAMCLAVRVAAPCCAPCVVDAAEQPAANADSMARSGCAARTEARVTAALPPARYAAFADKLSRLTMNMLNMHDCAAQVHDELLFLVHEQHLGRAAVVIRDAMQAAAEAPGLWCLSVPLPVKVQVGRSWGELEEYSFS